MAEGGNEDDRKLFVGGLPQEAKDTDVKEYFGTFGEIENINLKTDPHTGRSRGFAFIVYKEAQGVIAATQDPAHVVKGKKVTCKKAEARPGKIFLGKVPDEVSEDDIKEHFASYGTVTELVRPIDKTNNDKPKNFCFLTFDREEVAKKLVKEGECTIKGEKISIKRVTPKEGPGSFGGGRGGYGGFSGGWGYADPYAGYGGYGGYGDPYGGYGYAGGYGGGWGGAEDFGSGGGKMARGGAPRGRGRGRGGRPY